MIVKVNFAGAYKNIASMGADLKGRLNQSVPETREVNMWGSDIISYQMLLTTSLKRNFPGICHENFTEYNTKLMLKYVPLNS